MSLLSRKIAAAAEAGPGPGPLSAADGPRHLTIHLTAATPQGVSFEILDFAATDRSGLTVGALRDWGARLSSRLTYLMEPLIVLEVDPVAGAVELRSKAPTTKGETHSFYQVRLGREGTLALRRLAFDEGDRRRRPAPCHLTIEALERFTDDLVASVC